ncbi:MAG: HD domain-containing protein [Acidobacteria bacterium]|nr:HD domain-containing protein [Acidobacteriota bacterium]
MQQTLEAALAARDAVLPAKGADPAPPAPPLEFPGPRLAEALSFAIAVHGTQLRKGTAIPYVTHLLGVCALVGESGGREDELVAALLHDAVEDGGGAPVLAEIRARFGEGVAAIVAGCTDDDSGGEKAPWLDRKRAYLAHLASAPLPVLRVSCADKLHNARAIARDLRDHGPAVFRRFKADREGTLWYYRSLARLFAALVQDEPALDPGFRSMIRDLRASVAEMEG